MQPLNTQLIKIPFLEFVPITNETTVPSLIQRISEIMKYKIEEIRLIFELNSMVYKGRAIILNPIAVELTNQQGPLLAVKLDGTPIDYSKGQIIFRFERKCLCDKCNGVAAKALPLITETAGGKDLFVAASAAAPVATLVNA